MDLQLFVIDTEEWDDRVIHITNVTKHTHEKGVHKIWVSEDDNKISESAQRFYVKDFNLEEHKGAAYVIRDEIIMSHKIAERELKLLPAGSNYAEVVDDFTPLSPGDNIKDVITMKLKTKELGSRAAGYLNMAIDHLGVVTFSDMVKKVTKRKLYATQGVKEKTVKNFEQLLSEAGMMLRD